MAKGTHDFNDDPRNRDILVSVNGELVPRHRASVSVFDSGFILGDGVWEGIRLHNGRLAFWDRHARRLYEGAKALDMEIGLTADELERQVLETTEANDMRSGVHIRLMVTRGIKSTPYQDPRVTVDAPTIVIIAEHKEPMTETAERGIRLFTVHVRRGDPDVQDPKLNSHSKLNCITACIQAAKAGADEALMLDPRGFVATCNSTHFFIVREGAVWTSSGDYCLPGITRANVLRLCRDNGVEAAEKTFSLTEVYGADEAFVTGTFAGIAPVREVDGRTIGDGSRGPMTQTPVRIAMWSGPRHVSTAMMRAFENRGDTAVVDEPLYAHYLATTGIDHPGRHAIMASQPTDWQSVVAAMTGSVPAGKPIFYQKRMTHHLLPDIDRKWLSRVANCFLIRDPGEVLSSYRKKRAAVGSLADLGYPQQAEIFERVIEESGAVPPVIETNDLLRNPRGILIALCRRLDIPFTGTMLSWPAGPRDSDGVWAEHWYDSVWRSTGFGPYREPTIDIPDDLAPIAEAARPYYERLFSSRLEAE